MSMLAADLKGIEAGLFKVQTILKSPSELKGDRFRLKMEDFSTSAEKRSPSLRSLPCRTQAHPSRIDIPL